MTPAWLENDPDYQKYRAMGCDEATAFALSERLAIMIESGANEWEARLDLMKEIDRIKEFKEKAS